MRRTSWHIGFKPPTTRQKCRSKKSRTTAPPLRSPPQAAGRRWHRNMPQFSRPGLRWPAGRAAATSRMCIVSSISYRCAPHGMNRLNAGSRHGWSPVAFIRLSRAALIALSPTRRRKPTSAPCSARRSSSTGGSDRHPRHRLARTHPMRMGQTKAAQCTIVRMRPAWFHRTPICNRFHARPTADPKNENDGIRRRFLPGWDVQLEELNSLETARMRV